MSTSLYDLGTELYKALYDREDWALEKKKGKSAWNILKKVYKQVSAASERTMGTQAWGQTAEGRVYQVRE